MKNNMSELYRFLCDIGEILLANRLKGMAEATPISASEMKRVTGDVLTRLFNEMINQDCPKGMLIMEYDSYVQQASNSLQKPEHVSSLEVWADDINRKYVTAYRRITE